MKVLAVSPDRSLLEDLRNLASRIDQITQFEMHEGNLTGLAALPGRGDAEVLLLDSRQRERTSLEDIERLLALYPGLASVLIIDHETPDLLLRALRLGVREVLKMPVSQADLQSSFAQLAQKKRVVSHTKGEVHGFVSCKGGSGASFIATNLGYALGKHTGKKVLLIDLNLQFGDAVLYVSDQRPSLCLTDIARSIEGIDMALLKSALIDVTPNFSILAAPEDPTQSVELRPTHIEALLRFAYDNYDYVLLDMGRSLDTCSMKALDLSDHIYPVMQLTLPFLRDAHRLFDVFRSLGYGTDKLRPLLNRVECTDGDLSSQDAENLLRQHFYAMVPNHYKSVTASVNQGIAIAKLDPHSPVTQSLTEIAGRITGMEFSKPRASLFSRLWKAH